MADLNALIAQGYQFQAPPDPFVQYGRMQQLENSATQNQLARQQMTEGAALAPFRLAEIKAKSGAAQLELKQAQDAQDFVNGIMQKVAENHGGINDPMEAAQQMLLNPNPKVQMMGKHLAEAHQLVEGIKQQRAYAQGEPGTGGFAGIPAAPAPGAMPMVPKAAGPVDLAPAAPGEVGTPVLTGNALAPTSVNAMQPNRLAQIDKRLAALRQFSKVPEAVQERTELIKERDRLMTPLNVAAGGSVYNLATGRFDQAPEKTPTSADATTMEALGFPRTPEGFAAFKDAQRQERMLNPAEEAQRIRIARSGATTLNVSNVQEKAEAADYGKLLVKDYDAVKASASLAQKSIPAIESNLAILNKGFDTGTFTESKVAAAKVLGALGVKDAEKYASDSQAFLANASAAVLQRQLEQKGPQTEADAQRITQTGAQLGNTKAANEFVLKIAKAQLQRDIEQRDFYANWRDKNQTFNGAENAWSTGPGSKSLFERPELKAYAAGPNVKEVAPDRTKRLDQIFGGKR
jgi:hypothetical protein